MIFTKSILCDIISVMKGPRTFLGVIVALVLFSWAVAPLMGALDVWIVYNPRPAHPLHLLVVLAGGAAMFWAIAPAISLPLLGGLLAMTGGATSNLLWRITIGPVPDYIPLPFGAYGNVADMLIFLGGPLYIVSLAIALIRARRSQQEQEHYSEHEAESAAR